MAVKRTPAQQRWIQNEVLQACKRWSRSMAIAQRVRKRFEWATNEDVWDALDALEESGELRRRCASRNPKYAGTGAPAGYEYKED